MNQIPPSEFLEIVQTILCAQEDYEIYGITENINELLDGYSDEHQSIISNLLLSAQEIRLIEQERACFEEKLIYKQPPPPDYFDKAGIPPKSGVYFLWSQKKMKILYIGKSKNLKRRLRHHEKFKQSEHEMKITGNILVSYLLFDEKDISYVESYYIGAYKPELNFDSNTLVV